MQSFNTFITERQYTEALIKLAYVIENEDKLESIDKFLHSDNLEENVEHLLSEGLMSSLKKVGSGVYNSKSVIGYLSRFSTGAGKLVVAAVKGDKEKVKKIAAGMDRATLLDFIFKLDMSTLHLITGPLHMIAGITGWDIMHDIEALSTKSKDVVIQVKKAYDKLKTVAAKAFKDNKEKLKAIDDLENIFN